ncbi:ZIP family metal transporter [Mycoplasmopsis felifaucium]|uniref:ZIP family metal transporter n=1 Tax=Mycoplasmopsis felifaucium TaxID=35768 RepID=A0ABZ2RPJ5_9BACT
MSKIWENIHLSTGANTNLTYFIFILIAFGLLTLIPFLVTVIFAFSKAKLSQKSNIYLYSFICGFFITMATFGFLREALEISSVNKNNINKWITYGWNICIVVSGLVLGLLFAWGIRSLIHYGAKKKLAKDKTASVFIHSHDLGHNLDGKHDHDHGIAPTHLENIKNDKKDEQHPAYKLVAILLLLIHRIPESFLIGYIISIIGTSEGAVITSVSIAFIVSAILHLIPEQLVFYYRLREMGKSRAMAITLSSASLLIFLPFMFLGTYAGQFMNFPVLKGIIQSFVAGVFIFTSIVEFLPEFYHAHHDRKVFKLTMFLFMLGIVVCAFILSFHQHGAGI